VDGIHLAYDRDRWRALLDALMNFRAFWRGTVSLLWTVLCGVQTLLPYWQNRVTSTFSEPDESNLHFSSDFVRILHTAKHVLLKKREIKPFLFSVRQTNVNRPETNFYFSSKFTSRWNRVFRNSYFNTGGSVLLPVFCVFHVLAHTQSIHTNNIHC
jgi:hypothetical protein